MVTAKYLKANSNVDDPRLCRYPKPTPCRLRHRMSPDRYKHTRERLLCNILGFLIKISGLYTNKNNARANAFYFNLPPASLPLLEDARRESICKISKKIRSNSIIFQKIFEMQQKFPVSESRNCTDYNYSAALLSLQDWRRSYSSLVIRMKEPCCRRFTPLMFSGLLKFRIFASPRHIR